MSNTQKKINPKAVIYARVSTTKQVTEGSGLSSQETRCREYAKHNAYEVSQVFADDVSGGLKDRPGMKALLAYLRQQRGQPYIVIIDDISRLARDVEAHRALRRSISKAGGILESPSNKFADDPDSQFLEVVQAGMAELERLKNKERTINRMRARMQDGYWVLPAPPGYKYERAKSRGKILVRDEPVASVMREALLGFASGRFQTRAEMRRFLESHPNFPTPTGQISKSSITKYLNKVLYAGYIEVPNWGVSLRKGQHEPLISLDDYTKIQERLDGQAIAPARVNLGNDFALRGFVKCADCDVPLRSGWSKGRSKHYPYYLCQTKSCDSYGVSIRRDKIEGEFEQILKSLTPQKKITGSVYRDVSGCLGQALGKCQGDETFDAA